VQRAVEREVVGLFFPLLPLGISGAGHERTGFFGVRSRGDAPARENVGLSLSLQSTSYRDHIGVIKSIRLQCMYGNLAGFKHVCIFIMCCRVSRSTTSRVLLVVIDHVISRFLLHHFAPSRVLWQKDHLGRENHFQYNNMKCTPPVRSIGPRVSSCEIRDNGIITLLFLQGALTVRKHEPRL
jgi:hypothetical protein